MYPQMFLAVISTLNTSSHPSPFVERFKYDVISSSLLAKSLPSAHGRTSKPYIPGQLNHSRTPSLEIQQPIPHTVSSDSSYWISSLSALVVILLSSGHPLLAITTLGAIVYIFRTMNESSKYDISPVRLLFCLLII